MNSGINGISTSLNERPQTRRLVQSRPAAPQPQLADTEVSLNNQSSTRHTPPSRSNAPLPTMNLVPEGQQARRLPEGQQTMDLVQSRPAAPQRQIPNAPLPTMNLHG